MATIPKVYLFYFLQPKTLVKVEIMVDVEIGIVQTHIQDLDVHVLHTIEISAKLLQKVKILTCWSSVSDYYVTV